MTKEIYLDVRIASYQEKSARILAIYDVPNEEIIIAELLPYNLPSDPYKGKSAEEIEELKAIEKNSIVVVDSMLNFAKWDIQFQEKEHLSEAVMAYYQFKRQNRLIMDPTIAQRYDPEGIIEVRNMDMRGNVYDLNIDTENGHMCVMIACWVALRARGGAALVEQATDQKVSQDDIDGFSVPFVF